jgi:hypothetical protein
MVPFFEKIPSLKFVFDLVKPFFKSCSIIVGTPGCWPVLHISERSERFVVHEGGGIEKIIMQIFFQMLLL